MEDDTLDVLLVRYRERGDLLAFLKEAQATYGGLGPDLLTAIAERLGLRVADLYGIVSFYAFLSPEPRGRHTIRLCHCVPCRMAGGDHVRDELERQLGVKAGQTTADSRFTLELTGCVGACGEGGAMIVDEQRFAGLTAEDVAAKLAAFD